MMVRNWVVVIVGFASNWSTNFCSAAENLQPRTLGFNCLYFLVTLTNLVSSVLAAATVLKVEGANVIIWFPVQGWVCFAAV